MEPFPDVYWTTAQVCMIMCNLWSKGGRFKLEDFMPVTGDAKPKRQTPDQMVAAFKAATRQ